MTHATIDLDAVQRAATECAATVDLTLFYIAKPPEEQHFIMGGRQRGQSLPQDREIFTIHYRNDTVLKAAGQYETKKRLVRETFGIRYINRLARRRATAGAMHPEAEQETAGADDA